MEVGVHWPVTLLREAVFLTAMVWPGEPSVTPACPEPDNDLVRLHWGLTARLQCDSSVYDHRDTKLTVRTTVWQCSSVGSL